MKREMRIVGLGIGVITQKRINGEWKQSRMDMNEFEKMMKEEFTEYWNEYEKANTNKSMEEMIRKGEAYIYR